MVSFPSFNIKKYVTQQDFVKYLKMMFNAQAIDYLKRYERKVGDVEEGKGERGRLDLG